MVDSCSFKLKYDILIDAKDQLLKTGLHRHYKEKKVTFSREVNGSLSMGEISSRISKPLSMSRETRAKTPTEASVESKSDFLKPGNAVRWRA